VNLHFDDRMSDFDALLWAIEADPRLASTVVGVAVFEPRVATDAIRERVDRLSRVIPRLRQRVVGNPVSLAPPRWETDPHFDLDNHLTAGPCDSMRAADLDGALAIAASMAAEPFVRTQPLWHFHIVEDLTADQTVLIMKAHHAIADGMGMLMIQAEMFDFEVDADAKAMPDPPVATPLGPEERLQHAFEHEVGRATGAARGVMGDFLSLLGDIEGTIERGVDLLGSATRNLQTVKPLSPLMTERDDTLSMRAITLSLDDLKAAAKRHGTRLNATFVAGVAEGMRRYHDFYDQPTDRLRMGMPINVRGEDSSGAGNFFSPLRFELPINVGTPTQSAQVIEALVTSHSSEPVINLIGPAAAVAAKLPAPAATAAFARLLHGNDVLTSNIPGVPFPTFMEGSQMVAQFPFGPLTTAAVNLTLLSYLDEAHIGVTSNTGAVPDDEILVDCLNLGFDWVINS